MALECSHITSLLCLIEKSTFIVTQVPVTLVGFIVANPLHSDLLESIPTTIYLAQSLMSNLFNARALQIAFFRIPNTFLSAVSYCVSMSFRQIQNRDHPTIAYTATHIRQYMHSRKHVQHLIQFSHRGQLYTWMTFDSYDNFLISL